MTTIKATPEELRHLARTLRESGAHLRQLGDQAIGAAASANAPAAIGTVAEATSFAAGARVTELQTGVVAADTERVASLFEAADRGAGWFTRARLMLTGGWEHFGLMTYGRVTSLHKLWSRVPHDLRRSSWRQWQKELKDARTKVGRHWGDRGVPNTLRAWKNAQLRMLRHPKTGVVKFVNHGVRAFKGLGTNTSFLRKVKPLAKFGGKLISKVAKPLLVIQAYNDSKARHAVGKGVSAVVSNALTVHPVGFVADLATGGEVTKGVDGVVNTIASVGDSDRLSEMAVANAKGENGWAMQKIQYASDGLAEGIYNGWSLLSHGD